ncbi:MAG: hypothetical protein OET79_13455, partial [Nitrospirota bacterium]|nr:hypothetical protein [Nitrospirota bacterium]
KTDPRHRSAVSGSVVELPPQADAALSIGAAVGLDRHVRQDLDLEVPSAVLYRTYPTRSYRALV